MNLERYVRSMRHRTFGLIGCVLLLSTLLSSCGGMLEKVPRGMLDGLSFHSISQAKTLVNITIKLINEEGIREVVRQIKDEKAFWSGESYVFVLDARQRRVLANPVFPDLNGKSVDRTRDTAGNSLAPLVDEATTEGAWVAYSWLNPVTAKPARKISWVKKQGNYIIGSGIYQ